MVEERLEAFRDTALAALEDIDRALGNSEAARSVVTLDQSSVGRLSRMDAIQQQAMATGMKERLLRQKIRLHAALVRIDSKQYGVCCQCSEPIPLERLKADMAAPFCAVCQEEIDGLHG